MSFGSEGESEPNEKPAPTDRVAALTLHESEVPVMSSERSSTPNHLIGWPEIKGDEKYWCDGFVLLSLGSCGASDWRGTDGGADSCSIGQLKNVIGSARGPLADDPGLPSNRQTVDAVVKK
jgi:hypothetical protein